MTFLNRCSPRCDVIFLFVNIPSAEPSALCGSKAQVGITIYVILCSVISLIWSALTTVEQKTFSYCIIIVITIIQRLPNFVKQKLWGIMLAVRDTPSQRFRHTQFGTVSITVMLHFTRENRPSTVHQSCRFPPRRRQQIFLQ